MVEVDDGDIEMPVSFKELSKEVKQGKVCSCGKNADYEVSIWIGGGAGSHTEYWCKKCRKAWSNGKVTSDEHSGNRPGPYWEEGN